MSNDITKQEPLAPEVGGMVVVNDPYGAGEVAVEMAQSPFEMGTPIPGCHSNGDEPLEY